MSDTELEIPIPVTIDRQTKDALMRIVRALRWLRSISSEGIGKFSVVTARSAYQAASGEFVRGDTSASGFPVILEAATLANMGRVIVVKKVSADANTLVVLASFGQSICGAAITSSVSTATMGDTFRLVSNGVNWDSV